MSAPDVQPAPVSVAGGSRRDRARQIDAVVTRDLVLRLRLAMLDPSQADLPGLRVADVVGVVS